jgi:hypothetical protein
MTLEEAVARFTSKQRTAINIVGENKIAVKKRIPGSAEKPYVFYYARASKGPLSFIMGEETGSLGIGEYNSLDEVKNSFVNLPFNKDDINANGWIVSPE